MKITVSLEVSLLALPARVKAPSETDDFEEEEEEQEVLGEE